MAVPWSLLFPDEFIGTVLSPDHDRSDSIADDESTGEEEAQVERKAADTLPERCEVQVKTDTEYPTGWFVQGPLAEIEKAFTFPSVYVFGFCARCVHKKNSKGLSSWWILSGDHNGLQAVLASG
ncbi:unnamed protein product [Nezara viridula]|uniref:Uncharacterized protein n=1 Tax=Nezara viridula TaxID=85310 RepID=A0A9P0H744_NEZVI|nr:unnamed protein product [Nezara viridula]